MSNARALKMAGAGLVLVAGAMWFSPPPQLEAWLAADTPVGDGKPAGESAAAAQPAEIKVAINPLSTLQGDALKETLDRPLFNPGRAARPSEPPPAPPPPPPPEVADEQPAGTGIQAADLSLLAVAGSADDLVAMVRWSKNNQVYRLKRGQFLSELEMVTVNEREAVLKKDETVIVLALFTKTKQPAAETQPSPEGNLGGEPPMQGANDQADPRAAAPDDAAAEDAAADDAVVDDADMAAEDDAAAEEDAAAEDAAAAEDGVAEDDAADEEEPADPDPGAPADDGGESDGTSQ